MLSAQRTLSRRISPLAAARRCLRNRRTPMTNLEDGTPMSDDLTAFLTARLAEDEAAARTWLDRDRRPLREVEAKREILALIFQYEAKIDEIGRESWRG